MQYSIADFYSKTHCPYPVFLPLWRKAVFVDWHGVLCKDVFWFSILRNANHPYHARLREATEDLFTRRSYLIEDWMRGRLAAEDMVTLLDVTLDRRCRDDFLVRRLKDDCRRMQVYPELLQELQLVRRISFVILATDNMDCFIERLRYGKDLDRSFDAVLWSARLGVLKTDNVSDFFGSWLSAHNLSFTDSILLDDNPEICAAFRLLGGTAIVVKSAQQAVRELRCWCLRNDSVGYDA